MLQKIQNALANIVYPTQPEGLYEPISYVLSMGGKRLRPTLVLLAYSLFKPDWEKAMPAAIGLETYHNHTLLHDDLMDNADVRRGMPTVHKKWDANTAVLSGDTMLLLAAQMIASAGVGRMDEVNALFLKSAIEICEGQQYDVNFETRSDVTEAEYIEMIRLKTSVLLGCAAKMGALLADAPAEDCEVLYRFAEKVGLAFQLQDDYLDCFGDQKTFGKKIGGDILCGKKTMPLHCALQRLNEEEGHELLTLLNTPASAFCACCGTSPEDEKIQRVLSIYRRLDIPAVIEKRIEDFYAEARKELDKLSVDSAPIWEYATSLLGRKS
ncbi:MAG: polyprenyl synthetase family protein [Bacteroidales bacterium]|nr:polyprenyl synthetase family protein [Bacteroidales bacterium]